MPSNYEVLASMGHVRDLPKGAAEIPAAVKKEKWSRIGVNTTEDFEPLYIVPKDKKKVVKELKDALKEPLNFYWQPMKIEKERVLAGISCKYLSLKYQLREWFFMKLQKRQLIKL